MKKSSIKAFAVLLFIISIFVIYGGNIKNITYASENHSVEEIIENTVFISFRKEINGDKGNVLGVGFHVPTEYYYPEYKYGCAIFPEKFMARFDMYDDFLGRKERDGISVMDLQGNGGVSDGYRIMIYNVIGIPETALNQRLTYVFYVIDNDENVAYYKPCTSSVNSTERVVNNSSEWIELLHRRLEEKSMNDQFEIASNKFAGLMSSVWIYLVIGLSSAVVIWGVYIGIRIAVSKHSDNNVEKKSMIKAFIIGIIVIFSIAVIVPLLISGLTAWVG